MMWPYYTGSCLMFISAKTKTFPYYFVLILLIIQHIIYIYISISIVYGFSNPKNSSDTTCECKFSASFYEDQLLVVRRVSENGYMPV